MLFKEFLEKIKKDELVLTSEARADLGSENIRRWKHKYHKPSPMLALKITKYFSKIRFEFDDIQFFRVKHDVDLTRYIVKEDRERYINLRRNKGLTYEI